MRDVSAQVRENGALEARVQRPDGSVAWTSLVVSPASDEAGGQLVAILHDVNDRKELEAQLAHDCTHDALTLLPNRVLFRERVEHALTRCSREAGRVAVVLLDLDAFKAVNDTQGHDAGDRLLKVVAQRLLGATRGCDTVARLGGDEFAILLEQVDALVGAEAAVTRIVSALRQPIELETSRRATIAASFGIALYSGVEGSEELLRNADVAMYEAKLRTPGRWAIFDPSMQTELSERVTLEFDLRNALNRCQLTERPGLANTGRFAAFDTASRVPNEFTTCYQPVVELGSGRITSVEALARWTHPSLGAIKPERFIAIAELSGMVDTLGACVLREASCHAASWLERHGVPLTIAVNLSARQLGHDGLTAEIDAILRETGLAPQNLVLEITETAIMQNAETTLTRLRELKALGVRLAIDDFGTGYSSLSYLQRFPIDAVKIDRSFTHELRTGAQGIALMRTIIALARMLDLYTIAEGVEDEAQRHLLRDLGCEAGQGYLLGRPMSANELDELLAQASPTVIAR